ncbi:hypothetical protein [Gandjariella thermophila]|uniref:hypothetical protein n=1 Tax=Gandjariella thermophila TaxID=1931992 RepID=UPI0010F849FE|nr:hypothetical protein [Gandjariella thermophila]
MLSLALATGVCYGVTAALLKIISGQLRTGVTEPLHHWVLYVTCLIGPTGFLLSQNTFQQGRLVSPALAVITTVDPLIGVAIGVSWFGEEMVGGPLVTAGELLSGLLIVAGIGVLARHGARLLHHAGTPAGRVPSSPTEPAPIVLGEPALSEGQLRSRL